MNAFIERALIGVAKWITSPEAWEDIHQQVAALADTTMTGEEKRAIVIATAKGAGWKWGSYILNLLIEIAWAVIKAKIEKEVLKK